MIVALACASATDARAGDCSRPTFDEQFRRSAEVFVGRVVASDDDWRDFEVTQWWKGQGRTTLRVRAFGHPDFDLGRDYLVMGSPYEGDLYASVRACSNSRPLDQACDGMSALGPGNRPGPPWARLFGLGALVFLLFSMVSPRGNRKLILLTWAMVIASIAAAPRRVTRIANPPPIDREDYRLKDSWAPRPRVAQAVQTGGWLPLVALSPDGAAAYAAGYDADLLCRWAVGSPGPPTCIQAGGGRPSGLTVSNDGSLVASLHQLDYPRGYVVGLYDSVSLQHLESFETGPGVYLRSSNEFRFTPDGNLVLGGHRELQIIGRGSGQILRRFALPESGPVAFSRDGGAALVGYAVLGADGRWRGGLHELDLVSGEHRALVTRDCWDPSDSVAVSEDLQHAAWSGAAGVELFKLPPGGPNRVTKILGPSNINGRVHFSRDGSRLAVDGRQIRIFDVEREVEVLATDPGGPHTVGFLSNDRLLGTTFGGGLQVFDLRSGSD